MEFRTKSQTVQAVHFNGTESSVRKVRKFLRFHNIEYEYKINKLDNLFRVYSALDGCYLRLIIGEWLVITDLSLKRISILSDNILKGQYEEITEDIPPKEYELVGYMNLDDIHGNFITAKEYNDEVTDPLSSQWMHYKDYYNTPVYKQKD